MQQQPTLMMEMFQDRKQIEEGTSYAKGEF